MNLMQRFNKGLGKSGERIGELFGWFFNGICLYFGLAAAHWVVELF